MSIAFNWAVELVKEEARRDKAVIALVEAALYASMTADEPTRLWYCELTKKMISKRA